MPVPILVRLNLPGFQSPEPFRLANAPQNLCGLACAVLEQIGGFTREELEGVRVNMEGLPLKLYGELCAGQLVELSSDAELEVFIKNAESPDRPAIIEVLPREAVVSPSDAITQSDAQLHKPASEIPGHAQPQSAPVASGTANQVVHHSLATPKLHAVQQSPLVKAPSADAHRFPECNNNGGASGNRNISGPSTNPVPPLHHMEPIVQSSYTGPSYSSTSHESFQAPESCRSDVGLEQRDSARSRQRESRQQTPEPPQRSKQRTPGSLTRQHSSSACERRTPSESALTKGRINNTPVDQAVSTPGSRGPRDRNVPIHIRLHQDTEERRRRMEEARSRQIEKEQSEIRSAAQRALGRVPTPSRAPSPGRAASPGRLHSPGRASSPAPGQGRAASPIPGHGSNVSQSTSDTGLRSPMRTRPPLHERPSSASSNRVRLRPGAEPPAAAWVHRPVGAFEAPPGQPASNTSQAPSVASVGPEAASVLSGHGLHRVPSAASSGFPTAEDSVFEENSTWVPSVPDDVASLQQMVRGQHQRISYLENMHQQTLQQLRKSREELALAQQQRFQEADKVLQLEQLVSEMQAKHFTGDARMQMQWEDWLRRTRAVFNSDIAPSSSIPAQARSTR